MDCLPWRCPLKSTKWFSTMTRSSSLDRCFLTRSLGFRAGTNIYFPGLAARRPRTHSHMRQLDIGRQNRRGRPVAGRRRQPRPAGAGGPADGRGGVARGRRHRRHVRLVHRRARHERAEPPDARREGQVERREGHPERRAVAIDTATARGLGEAQRLHAHAATEEGREGCDVAVVSVPERCGG